MPRLPVAYLLFFISTFLFTNCSKECEIPAQCHTYSATDCADVLEDRTPILQDINTSLYELSGASPNLNPSELTPMDEQLKDAYFVGLGEATHGTSEFFQMKDRIFRYLVENHGFKAMGFEGSWGGALHVNQYVLNGIGSAEESIRKMNFWIWRTEEIVALVEWMRMYNLDKSEEDKLHFYGFDMQYSGEEEYWINEYLGKTDPALQQQISGLISEFVVLADSREYKSLPLAEKQPFQTNLLTAKQLYLDNQPNLVAASSQQEYDLIRHAFDILLQLEDILNDVGGLTRDSYMAINSEWIRAYLGNEAKVALWAHNNHVNRVSDRAQGRDLAVLNGENYQAIGFSFSKGNFQSRDSETLEVTTDNTVEKTTCNSVNTLLGEADTDNFYLIFDDLPSGSPASTFFSSVQPFFMWGNFFEKNNIGRFGRPISTSTSYDILIHFTNSTAAQPYE